MDTTSDNNESFYAARLQEHEKALRDKFVKEYFVDHDSYKACIRIGYAPAWALEFCKKLMQEPYVLSEIAKVESGGLTGDLDEDVEKRRILAALWREANNLGPGSSQSARVAALAKLSAFYGMDAPTRSKQELTGADGQPLNAGVFVVPGLATTEDWAKQAEHQQAALVRPTSPPTLKIA